MSHDVRIFRKAKICGLEEADWWRTRQGLTGRTICAV